MTNGYYVGQRVIYGGEIVVVLGDEYKATKNSLTHQWVKKVDGTDLRVDPNNLKSLPGGQL